MDKTTPMSPKPLVTATCMLGEKGCFRDGKCHALGNCEHKIVTNGDRIRAMTDEELAKAVLEVADSGVHIGFCRELPRCVQELDEGGVPEERCLECVKLWLNSPAEEEKA